MTSVVAAWPVNRIVPPRRRKAGGTLGLADALSLDEGDTEALGETLALALLLGLTLGDSLEEGDTLEDSLLLGETDAEALLLGETEALSLLDGLVEDDGEVLAL